jgi:hypothetical protein
MQMKIGTGVATTDNDTSPMTPLSMALTDFYSIARRRRYVCIPTGRVWSAADINAHFPRQPAGDGFDLLDKNDKPITIKATTWLDTFRSLDMGGDEKLIGRNGSTISFEPHQVH